MSMMIQLFSTLTIAGSTIVTFLIVLRLFLPNAISVKWYYGIGKMAIVFYLFPIALLIQWITSLFSWNATTDVPISGNWNPNLQYSISFDIIISLISVWGIGVIIFAGWQLYCYRKLLKKLQYSHSPVCKDTEVSKQLLLMKEVLGIQRNVHLAYSNVVQSPVLIGLRKPTIYLPMGNSADINMSMVFHHELVHLKRNDLWVKAFVLSANALHWFNPLVYFLRRYIHVWSEISCDEEVVKGMSYAERKGYGETILNVMVDSRKLPNQFSSSLSSDGKQLKRRLNMVLNVKKIKKHTMIISIIAMIVLGITGTYTAVWALAKTPEVETVQKTEGLTTYTVEQPNKFEKNITGEEPTETAVEMKMLPVDEATDQQIQEYQQQLNDVPDSDFWSDVEEDVIESNEIESQKDDSVEIEETIFVEVDNK